MGPRSPGLVGQSNDDDDADDAAAADDDSHSREPALIFPAIGFIVDCVALDSIIYVICFDIYHCTIHVFAFVKASPNPSAQPRASLRLGSHSPPALSPVSRILFGRRLFMAALLNINFIAFALAHLGAALVYSARTGDQTNEPRDRQTKGQTDERRRSGRVNWTLSGN